MKPDNFDALDTLGLVRNMELDPATVVAECNGAIIMREEYETYVLPENGRLELIRFVGGG